MKRLAGMTADITCTTGDEYGSHLLCSAGISVFAA
jgi:hypothetical protein